MLRAAYHMLKNKVPYQDLGGDYFIRRNKTAHTRRLLRSLKNLGYAVQLTPIAV
jgi:transposase